MNAPNFIPVQAMIIRSKGDLPSTDWWYLAAEKSFYDARYNNLNYLKLVTLFSLSIFRIEWYSSWNWMILLENVSFFIRLFPDPSLLSTHSCKVIALYSSVAVNLPIDCSKFYIVLIIIFFESMKVLSRDGSIDLIREGYVIQKLESDQCSTTNIDFSTNQLSYLGVSWSILPYDIFFAALCMQNASSALYTNSKSFVILCTILYMTSFSYCLILLLSKFIDFRCVILNSQNFSTSITLRFGCECIALHYG